MSALGLICQNVPVFIMAKKLHTFVRQIMKKTIFDMNRKQAKEEKEKKKNTEAPEVSNDMEQEEQNQQQEQTNEVDEPEEKKEVPTENPEDEKEVLTRQLENLNDKYLRLIAEYDNFRKRTLREKIELSKSAGEDILLGILPVMDDFDRARTHLESASDVNAVKEGINLIYNKLQEFLNQRGVKEIETTEQEFDSDLHEAVTKIPAPSEEMKGKIIDCVQKGYKLNDRVIRFPKVVVGE